MAWVYILKTASGGYYIGSTSNLVERLKHHHGGHTTSTKKLGIISLVLSQEYNSLSQARKVEYRLKRLKRKDYIEKIVQDGEIRIGP